MSSNVSLFKRTSPGILKLRNQFTVADFYTRVKSGSQFLNKFSPSLSFYFKMNSISNVNLYASIQNILISKAVQIVQKNVRPYVCIHIMIFKRKNLIPTSFELRSDREKPP